MTCSGSGKFICNICGAECAPPADDAGREGVHCAACGSWTRVRALAALISTEIFGVAMPLPQFPVLKRIRGIGMSDWQPLASRLAEKFDYTNTFYHQAPFFDVTQTEESDTGRYDFILSSEVLEHVPPPVERSFANLARALKPDGVLLMTTPYQVGGPTVEHFPDLHQYTLASPGGRTVLLNRRPDGRVEIFEDLMFHGGDGSTLEMRIFSEPALRQLLAAAGFSAVRIACENFPEFGVEHAETWSLPIAARKTAPAPPPVELAQQYRDASVRALGLERELAALSQEHRRLAAHHDQTHAELTRDLEARTEWARKMESELESRTRWAKSLEADLENQTKWGLAQEAEKKEALQSYEQTRKAELEAWECVKALEKELDETRSKRAQLEAQLWTRLGRKLKMIP